MKKLAYVLYDFHTGGMETSIYNIANELKEDFEFHFIATHVKDIHSKFKALGATAYIDSKKDLINYYRKHQIDIVQVNIEDWYAEAAKKAGVPRVVERTDGDRNCCKSSKKYVDHVIASTKGTVSLIAKQISRKKITVVYNGVDLKRFNKRGKKNRGGIPEGKLILGRAGRLVWGKRLDVLIDALAILKRQGNTNFSLFIVGGDSKMPGAPQMSAELKKQAKLKGVANDVVFVGDKEDPSPYVNAFDVCACVSMPKNEGIPNSLLEPMAASIPAIATPVGDVRELVDGSNGIFVPFGNADAVAKALIRLENANKRSKMGEAARKTIKEKFSLKRMSKRYREIYLG